MSGLIGGLGYALRTLAGRPGYLLVTVGVLALAIGANTSIFSLLNAYVLQPLPYPDSDRLVSIYNTYPTMGLERTRVSIPDYLDRRDEAESLDSVALYRNVRRLLTGDRESEQLATTQTTPSLFDVLRTGPGLGRAFSEDEAIPGQDRVVIISHRLWQTRFGGREDVVGSDLRLDEQAHRVVGVMPESFGFPTREIDAWVPFAFTAEQMSDEQRGMEFSLSIGRLAEGGSIASLDAEMDAIVTRSYERLSERRPFLEASGFTGRAEGLQESMTRDTRVLLGLLQSLVLAVLLIACANIANLQLARTVARRKELAVRTALGAGRRHLAGLVLCESLIISVLGALLGLGICAAVAGPIGALLPAPSGQESGFAIDATVLSFLAGVVIVATLVTGLVPVAALRHEQVAQTVNDSSRVGGGLLGRRARSALVVFQVAASVALLVSAGLLAKSFYLLIDVDPGFDATGVWSAGVVLPRARFGESEEVQVFYSRAIESLESLPGVTAAAFTSGLPFSGATSQGSYEIDGYVPPEGVAPPHANQRNVSDGYFETLGIPLARGRGFGIDEAERVAIVDELFVQRYFPDGNAIGQRVRIDREEMNDAWHTIVGVVPVVHHESLAEIPEKETIYWYYRQRAVLGGQVVVRSRLPPENLTPLITETLRTIDRDVVLADAMSMENRLRSSLVAQSAAMQLTVAFAISALLLAVLGIYGVLTWAVTQRTSEIGVRIALGARGEDIVAMVLRQAGGHVAVGVAFGLLLAVIAGVGIASEIYEVSPLDPVVLLASAAAIVLAALGASWLPARRATAVDPMDALRHA